MDTENEIRFSQTDSECESDVSSVADCSAINNSQSKLNDEHLVKRFDSLTQENRVLKIELQTYKIRLKSVENEIKLLKHHSVDLQSKAEQEEEFISNTLIKKIKELKKEKETLANNFEREEEFITNDLSRKLKKIRDEKECLEKSLEKEQSLQINQLLKRIQRLEAETDNKQSILDQLKKEKIDLENTLEKQQESLVNRLWKRMEKLETDKKLLISKLERTSSGNNLDEKKNVDDAEPLKKEIEKLRRELSLAEENHRKKIEEVLLEENKARQENLRLQKKLQLEIDRREELHRQWSESESSLEMDEERVLNEKFKSSSKSNSPRQNYCSSVNKFIRCRTSSSPSFLVQQNNEALADVHQRKSLTSNSFDPNH